MKIVKLVPGSGGTFYCENCMRDSALVKALRAGGHDIVLVPMYLPMYTDEPDITRGSPVFFGGINVYLQQKFPLFRRTPRWLDRIFDSQWMLKFAAGREGSTKASGMGKMTLSMIQGEDGNQAKELRRLVDWLLEQGKPDVVHISTVMLTGLVPKIKEALGVPAVCTLMDEDVWIDGLDKPYDKLCWEAMSEKAGAVDAFAAVSNAYGERMRERLRLPADKLRTVYAGIDLDGFEERSLPFDPPVIGYLSKLTPSLGLGLLVDAFIKLKRRKGLGRLKLRALGGITGDDEKYVAELRERLASEGMADDAEFLPEVDRASRLDFLKSISVMSVPVVEGEAFGVFMVEAWGMGVPVVQPAAGAFPELVEMTGGGIVYEGVGADDLADALDSVLRDPGRAREMGRSGREAVLERLNVETTAQEIVSVYESVLAAGAQGA